MRLTRHHRTIQILMLAAAFLVWAAGAARAAETAVISDAAWGDAVDRDNDGYLSQARLNWTPAVSGGSGALTVFEKIYYRPAGTGDWTLVHTTNPHTIQGTLPENTAHCDVTGGSQGNYDWRIEIFQDRGTALDDSRDSDNDADLDAVPMETDAEDPQAPVIQGVTPSKASAGTGARVTITGSDFGAYDALASAVTFFFAAGQPAIEAVIDSWTDDTIVCDVPTGEINGYPASAGSGPVTVTSAAGTGLAVDFQVTFGFLGARWEAPGHPPVVDLRVHENTGDCIGEADAVIAAADTWTRVGAAFAYRFAGEHAHTVSDYDGENQVLWGNISGALARAYIWSIPDTIVECDIVFNDAYAWSTDPVPAAGQYDVETVALHELGHGLGLRDLYGDIGDGQYDVAKVMYGYGASGQFKRTLHADDADGIHWIYGSAGDVNQDGAVDLADAILALRVSAGLSPAPSLWRGADVNADRRIGNEEAAFALQAIAQLRP
ncbi:MAG: choice-of-anchor H family protein [Desulfobacterales bacterium]|nr:choice-of-anchor H family protein [Desulfobacterales bacterium]